MSVLLLVGFVHMSSKVMDCIILSSAKKASKCDLTQREGIITFEAQVTWLKNPLCINCEFLALKKDYEGETDTIPTSVQNFCLIFDSLSLFTRRKLMLDQKPDFQTKMHVDVCLI